MHKPRHHMEADRADTEQDWKDVLSGVHSHSRGVRHASCRSLLY
jgi:hypothetical protein